MKTTFLPKTNNRFFRPARHLVLAGLFVTSQLFAADFGDAPDGTDTFYPVSPGQAAIVGQFPSLLSSNGARHSNLSDCWLGDINSAPSSETDAIDPSDPDGLDNLVNNDANDNGLPVIPFYLDLSTPTPSATVSVLVTVPEGAIEATRYLNMLIDWDQSGNWQNPPSGAPEWAVHNHAINVTPGTTQLVSIPITWGLGTEISPQIFWTRLTISRTTINAGSYPNGWDGTGSFTHGETEDFLFHPNMRHDAMTSPWTAPSNPAPGAGPGSSPPAISLIPANQSVAHGAAATITVNLDNGDAPTSLGWAIDPAQRGATSFDPGFVLTPFIGSYNTAPSGSTATATPGGVSPTLGSIDLTSVVDPQTPFYEEWPIRVRARWDGVSTQTAMAIVRIWHSGWSSVWAITSHFEILRDDIIATVPVAQQSTPLSTWDSANTFWTNGEAYLSSLLFLSDLSDQITDLQTAGHILAVDATRLTDLIADLRAAMDTIIGDGQSSPPVPFLTSHADGDTLSGIVLLEANTDVTDTGPGTFSYTLDGTTWVPIPGDPASFDTAAIPDGIVRLRVEMVNDVGSGGYEVIVWVDNNAPAPTLSAPAASSTNVGIIPIQVDSDMDDDVTTLLELSINGTDWHSIGIDADAVGGHTTQLDSGQLPAGSYTARATVTDAYGNIAQDSWSVVVAPSFHSWRNGLGVPTAQAEDDIDLDGLTLGEEYYLGLSATTPEAPADHLLWESLGGTNFQYRFTPSIHVDGLRAAVEGSTDLGAWSNLLLDPDNSAEVSVQVDTTPKKFVRLNLWEDRQ